MAGIILVIFLLGGYSQFYTYYPLTSLNLLTPHPLPTFSYSPILSHSPSFLRMSPVIALYSLFPIYTLYTSLQLYK